MKSRRPEFRSTGLALNGAADRESKHLVAYAIRLFALECAKIRKLQPDNKPSIRAGGSYAFGKPRIGRYSNTVSYPQAKQIEDIKYLYGPTVTPSDVDIIIQTPYEVSNDFRVRMRDAAVRVFKTTHILIHPIDARSGYPSVPLRQVVDRVTYKRPKRKSQTVR